MLEFPVGMRILVILMCFTGLRMICGVYVRIIGVLGFHGLGIFNIRELNIMA